MREHTMTDYPRFRPRKGEFEAAYRDHHGGGLVHLILRLTERGRPAGDADRNPMRALDRALLKGDQGPAPPSRKPRSAVRAAVAGIFVVLALSALVQVLGAFQGTGGPTDSTVAASSRLGAR
jgi:hypothetical protein